MQVTCSADSSSEYAFTQHSTAAEDRLDQSREEMIDFVRYLAFLNSWQKRSRGTPVNRHLISKIDIKAPSL